jgi:hypothetical protein
LPELILNSPICITQAKFYSYFNFCLQESIESILREELPDVDGAYLTEKIVKDHTGKEFQVITSLNNSNCNKLWYLGAIKIIRDTFSALFRPPPPPCDIFINLYQ